MKLLLPAIAFMLGTLAMPGESRAISLSDCPVPQGDRLVNICTQDIAVWYRLCNGRVGMSRIGGGQSEFNGSRRCGPEILHVCPLAEANIGRCRFSGA